MSRTWLFRVLAALVLALSPAGAAQATLVRADYALTFVPEGSGPDLTGYTLGGTLAFFYFGRAGDRVQANPGPPDIAGIAAGASGGGAFLFDLDLGAREAFLFLSFGGTAGNPGPPDYPVFAFWAGTVEGGEVVGELPGTAPLIDLGVISVGANPGPPDMPLFAFGSSGHLVGSLSVTFSQVPEPATALVVALGLAALAWAGRRRSRARR